MRFYVKYETAQEGPFDLVTMVRKIRNGAITSELLVLEENDEKAVPAGEHPQLLSFFQEIQMEAMRGESRGTGGKNVIRFSSLLKRGWNFLVSHHFSAVCSAVLLGVTLLLATIFTAILPDFMAVLNILLSWIAFNFLLSILLIIFLRIYRSQPCDLHSLSLVIKRSAVPLLFCAALTGIFSAIGAVLLLIPGLIAIALYSFAPLLIVERHYDFWAAMETSRKTILKQGRPLFEAVFGFTVINFIAGFPFVIPLAVTLPITYGALAEVFDEIPFD